MTKAIGAPAGHGQNTPCFSHRILPCTPGQAAHTRPPCTEADIQRLVSLFYGRVCADDQLGPIFERHVHDWASHLATLCDFWSALLLGTRRFKGAPITRHAALPDLNWALFYATTNDMQCPELKAAADPIAQRIATKLWQVYQSKTPMPTLPQILPPGLQRYSQSPVFTPQNLPGELTAAHTTRAGTWGLLRVETGVLRFTLDTAPFTEVVLTAGQCVVIEPGVPHHVAFELPGRFQIEFYRSAG